jgi:hypothetical protein
MTSIRIASRPSTRLGLARLAPLALAAIILLLMPREASAAFYDDWLVALRDWDVAAQLRRSLYVYPIVNTLHIFGFALILGSIILVDLRFLGAFPNTPMAWFGRILEPTAALGVLIAAIAGFFLCVVKPIEYSVNPSFRVKLVIIALAIINALIQRFGRGWRIAMTENIASGAVKLRAALSLVLWTGALFAGRFIAFLE